MAEGVGALTGVNAHGASFFNGVNRASVMKAVAHGLSRTLIQEVRYGTTKGAFLSGFVSSGFSIGAGSGYKGAFVMAIVGGTASELGGGKFANGAWSSAFQYLYNDFMDGIANKIAFGDPDAPASQIKEINERAVQGFRTGLINGLKNLRTVSGVGLFASMRTGQIEMGAVFLGTRQASDYLLSELGAQDSYAIYRHAIIDIATQPFAPIAPYATLGLRTYTKTSGDNYAQ
ncbi:MAG: hypothetical protein DSZ06_02480 [Sulfurospirillum sp.]|nr:MAG: hypothetical protein DSZ06_02480 [Sulfurospirillum sp.]